MPTVLVTGCNRGLGLEFARQYGAAGWQVRILARHMPTAALSPGTCLDVVLARHVQDRKALSGHVGCCENHEIRRFLERPV